MPEAHDFLLFGEHSQNPFSRRSRRFEALDNLHRRFVGAAVQRPAQSADRGRDRGMKIGQSRGDDAGGESRCVEFVLRVQNQRGVHRLRAHLVRRFAGDKTQKLFRDLRVFGLRIDPFAARRKAAPISERGREKPKQPLGDFLLARKIALRLDRAQHRASGAHDIHRMRGGGDFFQCFAHRQRQTPRRAQALRKRFELRPRRQIAAQQKIRDLLERRARRELADGVAAIIQTVAVRAASADGCASGRNAAQTGGCFFVVHRVFLCYDSSRPYRRSSARSTS